MKTADQNKATVSAATHAGNIVINTLSATEEQRRAVYRQLQQMSPETTVAEVALAVNWAVGKDQLGQPVEGRAQL